MKESKFIKNEIDVCLETLPNVEESVVDLFRKAKETHEARYFLTLIDATVTYSNDESYRTILDIDHWTAEQFARYFSQIRAIPLDSAETLEDKNFLLRLQMLAYSQFWECTAIKRLAYNLVRTAAGEEYDTSANSPNMQTGTFWKKFGVECHGNNLALGAVVDCIFHHELRNAFAHSDFILPLSIEAQYVSFGHPERKRNSMRPLSIKTWDHLFDKFSELLTHLFATRRSALSMLKKRAPYFVELDDQTFKNPFYICQNKHNQWQMVSDLAQCPD